MERFLWICLAGAAGTGARYLVALWTAQRFGSGFPEGTLFVNVLGCFAIATTMQVSLALSWSPTIRSAITIGFIRGLTMYSSFNYETTRLLDEGAMGAAALNGMLTIFGAFSAGRLGMLCGRSHATIPLRREQHTATRILEGQRPGIADALDAHEAWAGRAARAADPPARM